MKTKTYRYETHLHTKEASACASTFGIDYIEMYLDLGYSGIIVTDHFYHGNTAINRNLPWKEWVDQYCMGYEHAKQEGEKRGLSVFFGWEENFDGDEYLIYGLDRQWLLKHPEMLVWSQKEQYEAIHAEGGLVIQAHPYRSRNYLSRINLHPNQVDGMEVSNAGNEAFMDAMAYKLAKERKLLMTSGSDMHNRTNDSDKIFGMSFDQPLISIQDFVNRIRSRKGYHILGTEHRWDWKKEYKPQLPVYLFDEQNQSMLIN